MDHGMAVNFEKQIFVCKREKWNIPLLYPSGHVYVQKNKNNKREIQFYI